MKSKIICPYKATNNNQCTHNGTKKNRGGKRRCCFNYPHNCELFIEWVDSSDKHRKNDSRGVSAPN
jgi:hypothetical protein